MQKEESLFQAYNFEYEGGVNNAYTFQTESKISYSITFKPTFYLFGKDSVFSQNTFEFSILVVTNPTNKTPPLDKSISPTIASIFKDFYENAPETIAIYICDSSDGRQLLRKRKFNDWFEYYKGETFVKIDSGFKETDGTEYPVSLIIKGTNPFRTQIFDEFLNVVNGYSADK
jgi:Family of unknown function (DUF6169)